MKMSEATINTDYQDQATLNLLPAFDVFADTYKHVDGQPINAHILVPKNRPSGKSPVLIRIHGGAFSEGASDYWFRPW